MMARITWPSQNKIIFALCSHHLWYQPSSCLICRHGLPVASASPLIPKCEPFLLIVCSILQFATADGIREQLSGEQKKIPPPVLQENGHIDKEYFRVLAEKGGAFVTNIPPSFPEDHDGKCISMCVLVPPSRLRL